MAACLAQSLPIRLKAAKTLNSLHSNGSYEEILAIGKELSVACQTISKRFQALRNNMVPPTHFQLETVNIFTYRFLLSLHTPFSIKAQSNPLFFFSRKVCLEISFLLLSEHLSSEDQAQERLPGNEGQSRASRYFDRLPHDPLLIAAATVGQELLSLAHGNPSFSQSSLPFSHDLFLSSDDGRKILRKTMEEYADLRARRLKDVGDVSVSGHMLLTCLAAQTRAIETGMSEDEAVSAAAVETLEAYHTGLAATLRKLYPQSNNRTQDSWPAVDASREHNDDFGFGADTGFGAGFNIDTGFLDLPMSINWGQVCLRVLNS